MNEELNEIMENNEEVTINEETTELVPVDNLEETSLSATDSSNGSDLDLASVLIGGVATIAVCAIGGFIGKKIKEAKAKRDAKKAAEEVESEEVSDEQETKEVIDKAIQEARDEFSNRKNGSKHKK